MVKQRRALMVLRDGLEGCFHEAVCYWVVLPKEFYLRKVV